MGNIKRLAEFTSEELKRYQDIYNTLPPPASEYDRFGLRYSPDVLAKLGKKNIFFPLEVMAEFVEKPVKDKVDAGILSPPLQLHVLRACYHLLGATGIGNGAYAVLHRKDKKAVAHQMLVLEEIYKIETAQNG